MPSLRPDCKLRITALHHPCSLTLKPCKQGRSVFCSSLPSKQNTLLGLTVFAALAAFAMWPGQQFYVKPARGRDLRFVITSENCRVPDYGPWHESILPYVSTTPPVNCLEYPRYSHTDMTTIFFNTSAMTLTANKTKAKPPIQCCYRIIYRPIKPVNDNVVMESGRCVPVINGTVIDVEFIRLLCYDASNQLVYVNYHAFVLRKPTVEERCSRLRAPRTVNYSADTEAGPDDLRYSVLLVGADSLSRNNMKRSLPKTVRYLLTEMNATMMNGVNALGENTLENIIPLLTGQHMEEAEPGCWGGSDQFLDNCTFLWTMFADAGYRTLYAEDAPNISTFNYLKLGFLRQPTDYYSRPFVLPFEAELGHKKPLNCDYCVGPSLESEVLLKYTRDFAVTFRDEPYFAFTWINTLTHDYASTRWAGDEVFLQFFKSLYEGGHLNNTIVVFLSDHGMRWGSIRRTFAGLLEGRLPGYLWYLPRSLSLQHPDLVRVFKANAFRLTTPLDVYATLRSVLEDFALLSASGSEAFQEATRRKYDGRRMASLFMPVPQNRTCNETGMQVQWCSCLRRTSTSTTEWPVPQVRGRAVVREINRILEPYEDRCASLRLLRVDAAYAHTLDDPSERSSRLGSLVSWLFRGSQDLQEFTVSLITVPGEAAFEATARVFNGAVTILGDVLRVSLYGNRSHCVPTMPYRKFCHCLRPPSPEQ
ncbi:uncharacterized protein LOC144124376 [Amblyomma americanum]